MARRLLDSELLTVQFRFDDPEHSIAGLNRARPDPTANPTIVGYYEQRPRGGRAQNPDAPYVWCCHCQRPTHWEGFVVQDNSGETYIIGSQCGRQHYGGDFVMVERRFNEERLRKIAVGRWVRMRARIDGLEATLRSLTEDKYLALHDRKQSEFRAASPTAFSQLHACVQRGALEIHEKIRDVEAERTRAERYQRAADAFRALPSKERRRRKRDGLAPEEETVPIFRNISRKLGHVVGHSLLGFADVRKAAADVRVHLRAFQLADQQGTDAHNTKALVHLRKGLVESADLLRQNLIATCFCEIFFEADNLDRLETWSGPFRDFQYSRHDKDLHVRDRDRGDTIIRPIGPGNIPALQALEPFHTTVVEDDLEEADVFVAENQNDPLSSRFVA